MENNENQPLLKSKNILSDDEIQPSSHADNLNHSNIHASSIHTQNLNADHNTTIRHLSSLPNQIEYSNNIQISGGSIGLGHRRPLSTLFEDQVLNSIDNNEHGLRWRYDDYTTIDWIHDTIKDQIRLRSVRKKGGWSSYWDASQAWVVLTLIGLMCGSMASIMDLVIPVLENIRSRRFNLSSSDSSSKANGLLLSDINFIECALYILISLAYSLSAYFLVTIGPNHLKPTISPNQYTDIKSYDAAGSGIPEVKVILGGFVIRGFLGFKTLFLKFISLLLTIPSGLMVGVQGPLVHLSCALGNVTTRIFKKYKENDAKRREIMSAACAAGVSVAFGAPIGGVLFSLEEVSYYFPPKTMWRSFFCALVAAISVKIINPFGTGKLVMFQVSYDQDWHALEMIPFVFIGIMGGLYGGLFIKITKWITKNQLKERYIGNSLYQVIFISIMTSILSYPLTLARMGNTRFVAELLQECHSKISSISIGPQSFLCINENPWLILLYLFSILLIKIILMILTFGIRVPGGLFIPSMVVGGCLGRMVGMIVQIFSPDQSSIIPGVYAMVGAASTLSGVTRMTVSLSIIMFELTGGLQYVVPIMAGIMTSKWVADSLSKDSIYDQIIKENGFPYLNHKHLSLSKSGRVDDVMVALDDLVILDMDSVYKIEEIKMKLDTLLDRNEVAEQDGGFPLIKNENILIGYISFTELNHAIALIEKHQGHILGFQDLAQSNINASSKQENESPTTPLLNIHYDQSSPSSTGIYDVSQWVDKAPLQVSYLTSCEMVLELFSKLGVRSLVVVKDGGILCGLVHKKKVLEFLGEKARQE